MLSCDPIVNYYQTLQFNNSYVALLAPDFESKSKKLEFIQNREDEETEKRRKYGRGFTKSKKFYEKRKKRDFWVQTEIFKT